MGRKRKRKSSICVGPENVCIIHDSNHTSDDLVSFSHVRGDTDDKLTHLHSIRDLRLQEPPDSIYRMKALCDAILESLAEIDTDNPGCHNFCYAKFTKNLDRLKTQHTPK